MERDLILRAQAGDQRAFDALALSDYPRLYRCGAGDPAGDSSHAEDATQQAYLDIWRNIQRLRDPAKFEAWSCRLLVHACYAEARRTSKWIPDTALPPSHEPRAADAFAPVIDRNELEHGFKHLSVDQRAVIVMHYLLDMTLEQVAEALGLRQGTVNSRLSRGMAAMRKAMGPDYCGHGQQLGCHHWCDLSRLSASGPDRALDFGVPRTSLPVPRGASRLCGGSRSQTPDAGEGSAAVAGAARACQQSPGARRAAAVLCPCALP